MNKGQITTDLLITAIILSMLFLTVFSIYVNTRNIFAERKTIITAKTIAQQIAGAVNNAELNGPNYEEKIFIEGQGYSISFQKNRVEVLWQTPSGTSSYSAPLLTSSLVSTKNITSNSEITVKNTEGVIHVS